MIAYNMKKAIKWGGLPAEDLPSSSYCPLLSLSFISLSLDVTLSLCPYSRVDFVFLETNKKMAQREGGFTTVALV
jgi:hypothetical protein